MVRALRNKSFNRSHASYRDSSSSCWIVMISFWSLAFLLGGKYFIKNRSTNSCHVVMESGGKEFNHAHALSLNKYWNNSNLKASLVTPTNLKESLTSINKRRWRCRSLLGIPLNWSTVWSIWNIAGFNSNYGASILGLTILGLSSLKRGIAYWHMTRSLSLVTMTGFWALTASSLWSCCARFIFVACQWATCSLFLCLKVCSILGLIGSRLIIQFMFINT